MAAQNERIAGARLGITLAAILLWFGFAWSAEAALVKLDFEDLSPGTVVTNQYGDRGIVFSNHVIGQSPTAHSGTHVLLSAKPSDEIFQGIPIAISFNAPQRRVHLFAASSGVPLPGTLTAFDAMGMSSQPMDQRQFRSTSTRLPSRSRIAPPPQGSSKSS